MNADAAALSDYSDALKAGDSAALTALLQQADGHLPRGSRGEALLHSATSWLRAENRLALMTILLDAGVDVNAQDDGGLTPLHWAAGSGCVECVRLLIERGADIDARRNDGRTPLHTTASETLNLLLYAGADLRAQDKAGRVPLHTSMISDTRLLVNGVNVRDHYGLTPLHYAAL